MNAKKIKKILLIFPPIRHSFRSVRAVMPPLGLLYIAAVLRDAGYNVHVLDAIIEDCFNEERDNGEAFFRGLSFKKIEDRIKELKPDAVGISCIFSSSFQSVKKICGIAKKIDSTIVTFTGGAHPSLLAEKCLKDSPDLDYIVIGEGEESTKQLIGRLNSGGDVSGIDGLAYKKDGMIHVNDKRSFITDLDSLPFPARDLVPLKQYIVPPILISRGKRWTSITTSRGCPFECSFCASSRLWGQQYRERSVDSVLDEMSMLVKDYGIRELHFMDDNLTLNKARAVKLFQGMIDRKLDITWNAPNGVALWTLDEELLGIMKKSGCDVVALPIESGDQDVLSKMMNKPLRLEIVEKTVAMVKKAGLKTHGLFIIGFPYETPAQIKKTFALAAKLDLDSVAMTIAQPFPGTKLAEMVKEYTKSDIDYENTDFLASSYNTKYFTKEELKRMIARGFLRLNLSQLYRHPVRFTRRFGAVFFEKPAYSLGIVANLLRRTT